MLSGRGRERVEEITKEIVNVYNLSAKYCPELRKNKVVFKIMANVWATQTAKNSLLFTTQLSGLSRSGETAKNSLLFTSFTSKNVIDVASL